MYFRVIPISKGKFRLWLIWRKVLHNLEMEARSEFGARFICQMDDFIPARIFQFGIWERNLTAFISRRLRPGDVFIDVGANVGYFTLLASTLVGQTGRVVAIEASPSIFKHLERNLQLNNARNVRPVNLAAGGAPGVVPIFPGFEYHRGTMSIVPERLGHDAVAEAFVNMDLLTNIISEEEMRRARLIKIDVEGAEMPILENILSHINSFSDELEIVAELSALKRGHSHWAQLAVDSFRSAGFRAYLVENIYDIGFESRWNKVVPPTLLRELTFSEEIDVVFSRSESDTL